DPRLFGCNGMRGGESARRILRPTCPGDSRSLAAAGPNREEADGVNADAEPSAVPYRWGTIGFSRNNYGTHLPRHESALLHPEDCGGSRRLGLRELRMGYSFVPGQSRVDGRYSRALFHRGIAA